MKAEPYSPRDLFDGKVHFQIPVYQRPYVWDEEDQWAPLWEDILRVAGKVLVQRATEGSSEVTNHFLGAVVFADGNAHTEVNMSRNLVIDGQQRMTTLQVLLDAVQQVAEELEQADVADELKDLVLNDAKRFEGKPERFKLWPSKGDRDAFREAMDPNAGGFEEHRIVRAHRFFRSETERWINGRPDDDGNPPHGTPEDRASALSDVLQNRLQVVAINLTGHDDSQLIFETLNDRGTPLLKADLIKNWVFLKGENLGADVESWPDRFWADFDGDWWRQEISQGRLSRSRIDIFLQYWLTMRLREEVNTDQVFRVFTEYAEPLYSDVDGAERMLSELRKDSQTFQNFAQMARDSAEGVFYKRVIETMELAATTPLLLWMLSENHDVPQEQVEIGLGALESWVIRRTLLRYTMKGVNQLMVAMLKDLESVEANTAGDRVRSYLSRQSADARLWPADSEVEASLPKQKLYGTVRQGRLRVVLGAIEQRMRDSDVKYESVALPDGLELEHILPQGWRSHWDPEPKLGLEEAAARDALLNTLGNLTLVTKSLNGSLSNRPWTDAQASGLVEGGDAHKGKRTLLNKFSLLALNKEIVDEHADAWTEEDIANRSGLLAGAICGVWPGPTESLRELTPASDDGDDVANSVRDQVDEVASSVSFAESAVEARTTAHDFEGAMREIANRSIKEVGYKPTYFIGMLSELGGIETARRLTLATTPSDGFTRLWEANRLDLTVEMVVLRPEFEHLFDPGVLDAAHRRLAAYIAVQ